LVNVQSGIKPNHQKKDFSVTSDQKISSLHNGEINKLEMIGSIDDVQNDEAEIFGAGLLHAKIISNKLVRVTFDAEIGDKIFNYFNLNYPNHLNEILRAREGKKELEIMKITPLDNKTVDMELSRIHRNKNIVIYTISQDDIYAKDASDRFYKANTEGVVATAISDFAKLKSTYDVGNTFKDGKKESRRKRR
jgi:hypothetical protein